MFGSGGLNENPLRKTRYDRTSATRRMLEYDELIKTINKLRKEEIEWQVKKYEWLKKKHELLEQSNGLLADTSYEQLKRERNKLIEEREKWVTKEKNWADDMRSWIDFETDMHRTDMREVESHEDECWYILTKKIWISSLSSYTMNKINITIDWFILYLNNDKINSA